MLFSESVQIAVTALLSNKLRSILTMLGIIIGVGAVITMVALGSGAQKAVEEQIASLKPLVIIAVGDDPFTWATGMTGASTWRGSLFPSRIGGHRCWVYPIAYPYFAERPPRKTLAPPWTS